MKNILYSCLAISLFSCTQNSAVTTNQVDAQKNRIARLAPQCNTDLTAVVDQNAPASNWDKAWWLGKVERILLPGAQLSSTEKSELMKLDRVAILDQLMKRPEFLEAALDFNLYFLGFKQDQVRESKGFNPVIFDFPTAIRSALSLSDASPSAGNYFSLFDTYSDFYTGPLNNINPKDSKLTPEQFRQRRLDLANSIDTKMQSLIDEASQNPPDKFNAQQFCKDFGQTDFETKIIVEYGVPLSVTLLEELNYKGLASLLFYCSDPDKVVQADLIVKLKNMKAHFQDFFTEARRFDPLVYQPKNLADLQTFHFPGTESKPNLQFGFTSRKSLPNSSTNYDRKRAAYVLKNFFCDDLTPIQVESPIEHVSGKHGSDTSCFACHYKLDPMAGYFRNYGSFFVDFENFNTGSKSQIFFDDRAKQDLASYVTAWAAPPSSTRKWNVGYIRSPSHEEMNDYGDGLEDLFALMKRAPEVKRCLAKRAFAYATSEDQTLDSGYLDQLSEHFTQTSTCQNSSLAFKNLLKEILLSSSFITRDPVPDECYDFPKGYNAKNAPPCKINAILQRNCVSCHSPTGDQSDLDFTQWKKQANGEMNFIHLDDQGKQYTQEETLQMIQDRLQLTDLKKRMPKDRYMNPLDRATLFTWIADTLREGSSK